MKIRSTQTIAVITACTAIIAIAGCKGQKGDDVSARAGEPQRPADYHDSLSSYSFEKRDEFASQLTAMRAEFNAKVAELETRVKQSQLSDEARGAMAELDTARTQFEKLISALPTATAETWQTARDDVNRAWDRMQAAYERTRKSIEGASY